MIRIRHFEDKCAECYTQEKIRGFLHLYDGEEAVAVGVIPLLGPDDRIVATYREHGHALVRGVPMNAVMAEMFGRREGCAGGRGGSMHLFSRDANFYGGNAIVGGGLPLAVGLGARRPDARRGPRDRLLLRRRRGRRGRVPREHEPRRSSGDCRCFSSARTTAMRWAPRLDLSESETDIHAKAKSYAIESEAVDGMDVVAVEAAARRALKRVRGGGGPYFLECRTYRFRAHSMFDAQLYRPKEEIEQWRAKGPIVRFQNWAGEERHHPSWRRGRDRGGGRSRRSTPRSPSPRRARRNRSRN